MPPVSTGLAFALSRLSGRAKEHTDRDSDESRLNRWANRRAQRELAARLLQRPARYRDHRCKRSQGIGGSVNYRHLYRAGGSVASMPDRGSSAAPVLKSLEP